MLKRVFASLGSRLGIAARARAGIRAALASEDALELRRCALALLQSAAEDPQALEAYGVSLLWEGQDAAAMELFAHADSRSRVPGTETRLCLNSVLDAEQAARRKPYVAVLEDVLVDSGYWIVIDGERGFIKETSARRIGNSPLVRQRVSRDRTRFVATLPPPAAAIDEPCLLVGGDGNYSHWLERYLLKIAVVDGDPRFTRMPMLVNEDLRPFQSQYLELLGIGADRLVKAPRDALIRCRRLAIPTMLRDPALIQFGIAWIRQRLSACIAAPPPDGSGELVYLSRRDAGSRRLVNEADLIRALEPMGFRVLVGAEMTVRAQIEAFSRIRVVVAPHGAGLANLIFAPSGAFVLEIQSAKMLQMSEFESIARQRGQRFARLVSHDFIPEHGASKGMHQDFRVDVSEVVQTLRQHVAAW